MNTPFPRPLPPPPIPPRPRGPVEVPEHVLLRHVPPLECHWCATGRNGPGDGHGLVDPGHVRGHITVHDRRGCHHLCFTHAKKRMEKNFMFGHSPDCPYHDPKVDR